MKTMITYIITMIVFAFTLSDNLYSWELYDRIIATVNDTPLVESEINTNFERLIKLKKIPKNKIAGERSLLLDKYIDDALVMQTANDESIIVSEEKIRNHIEKIMNRMNISSIDIFIKKIEQTDNITFDEYKEEIKKSLIAEQVMSIAVGVSPPSEKDALEWYKTNQLKIGFEVNIQHIFLKLENESFSENKKINKIAKDLYRRILNGENFETLVSQYSQDGTTSLKGGTLGWVALSNLAKQDLILTNNIYKEFVVDRSKLAVVKSEKGYHIIKLNGKRPTSFEIVKDEIISLLYQQRAAEQFKKWVNQKRLESDIKIYMEDYVKPKLAS